MVEHPLILKANKMHYYSIYFRKQFYVFRTDLLSIIRGLTPVFTAINLFHGVSLPETCRDVYQNQVEKLCILVVFTIRIYQDARSSEYQILNIQFYIRFWDNNLVLTASFCARHISISALGC